MFAKRLVVVLVVVGFFTSFASAGVFFWDFQSPPMQGPSIQYLLDNHDGEIQVGDKVFTFFDGYVVTSSTQGTVAPGAAAITLTGIDILGDYGLRFNAGWSAGGQEIADTTITFKVAIVEPWLAQGWLIKDNALWISAYGVSGTGEGGIVSVSENVYAQDPNLYPPHINPSIANKFVYYRSDTDQELYDERDFMDMTDPNPDNWVLVQLAEIWVKKDIIANGGDLLTGAAHLSEFSQTFSQIPEPATLALLGLGGIGVLIRRRRK